MIHVDEVSQFMARRPMKALVCGGRTYRDADTVFRVLSGYPITHIVHGGARGADTLADQYARKAGLPVAEYRAKWHTYGKAAGALRNAEMLADGRPHIVIAFPGGTGTADMVRRAKRAGVPVVEVPA